MMKKGEGMVYIEVCGDGCMDEVMERRLRSGGGGGIGKCVYEEGVSVEDEGKGV